MTTNYDAMSDEQLAALVAERVMGWEYMRDISAWITYDAHTDPLITHANAGATRPWSPATSWADAGRVLEKMRERGWTWTLRHEPLSFLVAKAVALAGGNLCADGCDWRAEGGRACPRGNPSGSQAVYRCRRCGGYDYGNPGGPGHADCFGSPWACDGCDP